MGLLAEAALAGDLDRGSAGDRYQVMLHVEMPTGVAAGEGLCGTVEVDHGAVDVSAETSRRMSCDASVVPIRSGSDGTMMFLRPNGTVLEAAPALAGAQCERDRPVDDIPVWDGARFDLVYAIDVLYSPARREDRESPGRYETVSGSNRRHHLT
jgi:hypothetical protein